MKRTTKTGLTACLAIFLLAQPIAAASAAGPGTRTIRLGYYDAKPSCFRDASGKPGGVFIEIIEAAAARAHWSMEYEFGTWDQLLDGLRTGRIDLVPAIIRTRERETFAAFTQESVMSDWGVVYARPGGGISSILDLRRRKVGALDNDFWFSGNGSVRDLCASFGVVPTYSFYPDYPALFEALVKGEVDAVAASNSLGIVWTPNRPIVATSIVYNPIELRFAASRAAAGGAELAQELDTALAAIRRDSPGVFSTALARFQLPMRREFRVPPWLGALLALTSIVLIVVVTLLVIQGRALRTNERRLASIFEDSPMAIWEEDFSELKPRIEAARASGVRDWAAYFAPSERVLEFVSLVKVLDVNRATLRLLGYSTKAEVPAMLSAVLAEDSAGTMRPELIALAQGSQSFEGESVHLDSRGRPVPVQFNLSIIPGFEETWSRVLISTVDVSERARAEQALVQSLAEKELLLREIHHRVKNNLQIISSLIHLQLDGEEGIHPATHSLVDMEARVRAMSFVHEVLYQSDNFGAVEFSSYVGLLCSYLLEAYAVDTRRVRLVVSVEDIRLPIEKAIPCGLLINELVVNALKHAFPDGRAGRIEVAMSLDGASMVSLAVRDDGVGAPPELEEEGSKSIGLSLVRNLAGQLRGTCRTESGGGFAAMVSFPA